MDMYGHMLSILSCYHNRKEFGDVIASVNIMIKSENACVWYIGHEKFKLICSKSEGVSFASEGRGFNGTMARSHNEAHRVHLLSDAFKFE